MKVRMEFEFTEAERMAIGRTDGRPGPARRADLREFVELGLSNLLAGEWDGWAAWRTDDQSGHS